MKMDLARRAGGRVTVQTAKGLFEPLKRLLTTLPTHLYLRSRQGGYQQCPGRCLDRFRKGLHEGEVGIKGA